MQASGHPSSWKQGWGPTVEGFMGGWWCQQLPWQWAHTGARSADVQVFPERSHLPPHPCTRGAAAHTEVRGT